MGEPLPIEKIDAENVERLKREGLKRRRKAHEEMKKLRPKWWHWLMRLR